MITSHGAKRIRVHEFVRLIAACICISVAAFSQDVSTPADASDLLAELLSAETSDNRWSAAKESFESLPLSVALPLLFREIAKGIPGGYSYTAYNCFDPLRDRKVDGWGQFCVVNSLWCKQIACKQRHEEVSKVLLKLWVNSISEYGQGILLEGICGNPDAESKIATLFRDEAASMRLRTQAAVCLLRQAEPIYHSEVVDFAEKVPNTFTPPGLQSYPLQLRRALFDELASSKSGRSHADAAVVRLGFSLMLDDAAKAKRLGNEASDYGPFLYAERLNVYLGTSFEPDRKQAVYVGSDGNERFWHDTTVKALSWWAEHKHEYSAAIDGQGR